MNSVLQCLGACEGFVEALEVLSQAPLPATEQGTDTGGSSSATGGGECGASTATATTPRASSLLLRLFRRPSPPPASSAPSVLQPNSRYDAQQLKALRELVESRRPSAFAVSANHNLCIHIYIDIDIDIDI